MNPQYTKLLLLFCLIGNEISATTTINTHVTLHANHNYKVLNFNVEITFQRQFFLEIYQQLYRRHGAAGIEMFGEIRQSSYN